MNATIETYSDKIIIILPLEDDFYGRAGAVAQVVTNEQMDMALTYFLPKIATAQVSVYQARPEVEAAFASKIIARECGWTRKAL